MPDKNYWLKKLFFISLLSFACFSSFAQTDSNSIQKTDTPTNTITPIVPKPVKKRHNRNLTKNKLPFDSLLSVGNTAKKDTPTSLLADTTVKKIIADTLKVAVKPTEVKKPIDSIYLKLLDNPYLRTKAKPIYLVINERKRTSKDEKFYLLSGLILLLAFIKLGFNRYFTNLFRLFFQPSFRQKQTREQLQQGDLPSLMLNLFFILLTGAYISFLAEYYFISTMGFWKLWLYASLSLAILYTGKYIFLRFAGWVFNVKEASEAYIFAVYLINKILGIILVPFTLVIAFSQPGILNISITISILLILLLFVYRYVVSYATIYREVKVSAFHFFIYIFAFEIIPLLLIYKTLMLYLNKSL